MRDRESDEANRALVVIDFFEQLFGEGEYGFEVGEGLVSGVTARELGEVVELDFEREGIAYELLASETLDEVGCDMVELDDDRRWTADITLESVFTSDRLANIDCFNGAIVDATSKVVVGAAHLAKLASEHLE